MPLAEWSSEFGNAYHARNPISDAEIEKRHRLFDKIANGMDELPWSWLEVGAGKGENLAALQRIYWDRSDVELIGLEPNGDAWKVLREYCTRAIRGDGSQIPCGDKKVDVVFTYCCLIHVPLAELSNIMAEMFRVSRRYILCVEYWAAEDRAVRYRDREGMLWLRDYIGLWLENYPLRLLEYGFCHKSDTGLDGVTWSLFEKRQ